MAADEDMMLPWGREELEELVHKVVSRGEGTKVDLKRQLNISTAAEKAELLKDISAIANCFERDYQDHGLIVFGARAGAILPTSFDRDEDHTQAAIDQIVKGNIQPFINTSLFIFGDESKGYAVLVIPPTRNAPHMFVRDIDRFHPGDTFVRRGTTTERAQPGDFARFFRQHVDALVYPLYVELREMRRRVVELEGKRARRPRRKADNTPKVISGEPLPPDSEELTIQEIVGRAVASTSDPVTEVLVREAASIRNWLATDGPPWALQVQSKEQGEGILSALNDRCRQLWQAIGRLVVEGGGRHDGAIIRSVAALSEQQRSPIGTPFNDPGAGIRYLPLVGALHVAFVAATETQNASLLKKLLALELRPPDDYTEPVPISEALFRVRAASEVFQSQHPNYPSQRWCDAVSNHMRTLVGSALDTTDPLWSPSRAYFRGEFVLALAPLAAPSEGSGGVGHQRRDRPAPGGYLYFSSAAAVIRRFLKERRSWLEEVLGDDLRRMLREFDEHAHWNVSPRCDGDGFQGGAEDAAFKERAAAD